MRALCKIISCITIVFFYSSFLAAQCNPLTDLLGSFQVLPGQDTCVEISLERLANNDLTTNNDLQGIDFEFSHNNIGDLLIELTSPSGQMVTLIGDITTGFPTNGSEWNVLFSECSGGASPDAGIFSDAWDNADNWTTFTTFTGIYHPHIGCLEDFNSGSVNGTWKLNIINTSSFETTFIDRVGFTLTDNTCIPCAADAGTHGVSDFSLCTNDDLILDLQLTGETNDPDYTLAYVISNPADEIVNISLDNDFNGLPAGDYTICAVSISNDEIVSLINLDISYSGLIAGIADGSVPFCMDIADNCTELTVNTGPPIRVINAVICEGDNLVLGADVFTTEGSFAALLPAMNGDLCDTTVVLNLEVVNIMPLIQASASELGCGNPTVILDGSTSIQENGSTFMWSTMDGIINTDPSLISIEISAQGTYMLSQTENECTRSTTFVIGEAGDVPQILVSSDQLSCVSESVILTLSGASVSSASWTGPNGFSSSAIEPEVSIPGLYQGVLTASGCQVNVAYQLDQGSDQPSISASAPSISCATPGAQVTVDDLSFALYRWTGPAGFVSNNAEPVLPVTGVYFLEVQNEDGCKGFASVEIFGDESSFEYEVSGQDFLCNGGRVTISATSEIPGSTFSWTGPNNYFSSAATNSVTAEGTYYVDIIANGCIIRDSVTLGRDISDLPEYDFTVENIGDCENPLWRLTAIPLANEFQTSLVRWGIAGVAVVGSGNQIDVSETGDYFLLINTFNGCTVVYRFTIDPLPASPIVAVTGRANVTCTNGNTSGFINVTDNSDYAYNWTHRPNPGDMPSFIGDTSSLENLEAGFYSLTVTDINTGCVSFLDTRVVGDTIPRTISLNNTNIDCNDPEARVVATVNGGGNSYEWNGPDGVLNTKDIQVSTAGAYVLTVTGSNGCESKDSVTILADINPPSFNLSDQVLACATQSADLDPNNAEAGVLYNWSGPDDFTSTSAIPTVFASGDYDLTLTGLNGCTAETSVVVTPNTETPVPLAISNDTLNCINEEVEIQGETEIPVVSYFWNGPASFISSEQNPTVTEAGEYVLTIESTEGCIGFDTVEVIQEIILPPVNFTFEDNVDCINIDAMLTGISSDPGDTFLWEGPNGFSSTEQVATAQDTGTYIYYVRGGNNCVDSDTFNITSTPLNITSDVTSTCSSPSLTISELSDEITYTTTWTLPDGTVNTEPNFIPSDAGTYQGILMGSTGCTAFVTANVTMDTLRPIINVEQVGEVRCEADTVTLNTNGSSTGINLTYTWVSLDGMINSDPTLPEVQVQGAEDYNLFIVDTLNGCSSGMVFTVEEEPQDFTDIDLSGDSPRCFGENNGFIRFNNSNDGTGPYSTSLDGLIYTSDSIIGGLAPGTYEFFVKDDFGCVVSQDFTIAEQPALELDLGENIDVFLGNDVEITATTSITEEQIESIFWQIQDQLGCSDCLSFTLSPDEDLLIELTLTDERGCTITDEVKVRVDQNPVLFKPNIFSPNEDGVNDLFYISANPGVTSFPSLEIFDRWGEKVFSRLNLSPGSMEDGWDGNVSGNPVNPGVYVYTLEVEMVTGAIVKVEGDITVIR